jgi:lipopolysaccharide export system protein LptA
MQGSYIVKFGVWSALALFSAGVSFGGAYAETTPEAASDITSNVTVDVDEALDPSVSMPLDNPDRAMPLEVTADYTLEWHRNDQQYIAKGNAIAKQGDMMIKADSIVADYKETQNSSFDIYRLTATGNVRIETRGNTGRGGKLVYDVDKGVAVMTGEYISLASPDQSLIAKDKFEYRVNEGKLMAFGDVRVLRAEDRITADRMTAYLSENPETGKRELRRMTASDNVVITTQEEVLTGDKGEYNAGTNVAFILGNVKITRGPNVLEGEKAEVNLATNISKMYSAGALAEAVAEASGEVSGGSNAISRTSTGRVRGVFYPKSTQKPETDIQ